MERPRRIVMKKRKGSVVEKDGGFISFRSPLLIPSLDLSSFTGLEINVMANGLTLKLAISCDDQLTQVSEMISGGLKWVLEFDTNVSTHSKIRVTFVSLLPSIRAKPLPIPISFNASSFNRIQLLYSKFGSSGELNNNFQSGPFNIHLESISAYK